MPKANCNLSSRQYALYNVIYRVLHYNSDSCTVCPLIDSKANGSVNFLSSLAKEFRLWLDAARSLFLFASHFGIAVWFACEAPSMKCVTGGSECPSSVL